LTTIPLNQTIQAEDLLDRSRIATGLDDFGKDAFAEPLERLLNSLHAEARLSPSGFEFLNGRLIKSLSDRLRIQAALTAHPEILDQPINPIIITGLNRTGTTKLHRLMASDPRFRSMPLWEAYYPVPLEGEAPGANDKRVAAAKATVHAFMQALPQAHAGHPIFATVAEEETYCAQMELQWTSWFGYAHAPTYMNWVIHASMAPAYSWFRKTLQYMQWQNGGAGRRWLLKAPFHIGFLEDLEHVFPGVEVIQCHRAPLLDPIASIGKLVLFGRRMGSDTVHPLEVGPEVCGYLAASVRKHMLQIPRFGRPIIDVDYRDTVERAEELAADVYRRLGVSFGEDDRSRIRCWERENPQHVHGKFIYDAADVGLNGDIVNRAFGPYVDWLANVMRQRRSFGADAANGGQR
jgi:hypothetical protein